MSSRPAQNACSVIKMMFLARVKLESLSRRIFWSSGTVNSHSTCYIRNTCLLNISGVTADRRTCSAFVAVGVYDVGSAVLSTTKPPKPKMRGRRERRSLQFRRSETPIKGAWTWKTSTEKRALNNRRIIHRLDYTESRKVDPFAGLP